MAYTMLAPNPLQQFVPLSGTVYTSDAQRLIANVALADVRDLITAGCVPLGPSAVNDAAAWNQQLLNGVPITVAAAGATTGGATKVTGPVVNISATTSAQGVQLKAVATGAMTYLRAPQALNTKFYTPPGYVLDATASATATVISAGKGVLVQQLSGSKFTLLLKGA